jgi:hypothetical protein
MSRSGTGQGRYFPRGFAERDLGHDENLGPVTPVLMAIRPRRVPPAGACTRAKISGDRPLGIVPTGRELLSATGSA